MALTSVAYGPFTENEIPEALLVRVMKPLRAGGTTAMDIYNEAPPFVATASIEAPNNSVTSRTAEIMAPADLPVDYPQDFSSAEEGWVRIAWEDGDFPNAGIYEVQLTLDNGVVRLKSTEVWVIEVNAGPASDVL